MLLFTTKERIEFEQITLLELAALDHLVEESLAQQFRFVERLVKEYRSGFNCFNKAGEILITASLKERVIGIAGLNQNPYVDDPEIGRLRHLYVESNWRRRGVGSLLVSQIVKEADRHYQLLTLRTDAVEADQFYQQLGFKTNPIFSHTTHHLRLNNK